MAEKIIIASGKGGAGKTSLTTGLAFSLTSKGKKTLIIDFDIGQSCVEFMLGSEKNALYTWGDAIYGRCSEKDTLKTANGISYIAAPSKFSDDFTEEKMKKFVMFFDDSFDYILFDSPAGLLGGFRLAAACADRGIIVTTSDEICTKAAYSASSELLNYGIDDIKLVINRFSKKPAVKGKFYNIDEVIDIVGIQLLGVIPEDKQISYASSTGFSNLKDCPGKAAYGRIADRVRGIRVKLVLSNSKKERPKSKAPVLIAVGIIIAAVLFLSTILTVDCVNCAKLHPPVFAREVSTENDDVSVYKGLFYTVVTQEENGTVISSQVRIKNKVITAAVS